MPEGSNGAQQVCWAGLKRRLSSRYDYADFRIIDGHGVSPQLPLTAQEKEVSSDHI